MLVACSGSEFPRLSGGWRPDNIYEVMVMASDGANSDTEAVEMKSPTSTRPARSCCPTLQPQVEEVLMATLTDSDDVVSTGTVTWMWFRGSSVIVNATAATYTPMDGDIGSVLKAKATYRDAKTQQRQDRGRSFCALSAQGARFEHRTRVPRPEPVNRKGSRRRRHGGGGEHAIGAEHRCACCTRCRLRGRADLHADTTAEATFDIDRATGQLKTKAPLDYEETASTPSPSRPRTRPGATAVDHHGD